MATTLTTGLTLTEKIMADLTLKDKMTIIETRGRITMEHMIDMRRFLKRDKSQKENPTTQMMKMTKKLQMKSNFHKSRRGTLNRSSTMLRNTFLCSR